MMPLVLIPGMMCDARLFAPQIAALSARRSIFLAAISDHDTIAASAAAILAQAPERFALAGLSMGEIVAMEMVRQACERIDRIALLDTNPLAETKEARARRLPQIEAVRQRQLGAVMRDQMKPKYLVDGPGRAAILDLCMDMATALGPEVFIRQSHALMTRPDQTATLRDISVDALVLCGHHDALCPTERHRLMADLIPGAHLEIIDHAGHLPTLEQPEKTNMALERWLEA